MILHWRIWTGSDSLFSKICGSGLDWIQFYRIRTALGLKNFTVHSSLLACGSGLVDDEMDADFAHLT